MDQGTGSFVAYKIGQFTFYIVFILAIWLIVKWSRKRKSATRKGK